MFKFNFTVQNSESNAVFEEANFRQRSMESKESFDAVVGQHSRKVYPTTEIMENYSIYKLNSKELNVKDVAISHVISRYLLQTFSTAEEKGLSIRKAEEAKSDLIPGVYEGGAKIWECTYDLLLYLSENLHSLLKGKNVLDLGCGSGLLGIYCYKRGSYVHFQDYNEDVLEKITIPNVLLNFLEPKAEPPLLDEDVQFYSGDWSNYAELTRDADKFDIILSSETIYNPNSQQKLLNTIHDKIKSNGMALIAAKTCYFGIGGGMRQFEDLILEDKRFSSTIVWVSTGGVSREIIQIKLL